MGVLLVTDLRFLDHDPGRHHPEQPARLSAVLDGLAAAGLSEALVPVDPRRATDEELLLVHDAALVAEIDRLCGAGGGAIDADTAVVPASWDAALHAAGSGLTAVAAIDEGLAPSAFCAVRPPGHHATAAVAMGFCLLNNVAVTAAHLAGRGERVLIADFDAHHGNGTQDVFYADDRVMYVSWHQWPLYPGTGRLEEIGTGRGYGSTINVPLPPGATAEHLRGSLADVVAPAVLEFDPTWLLISAGFDGHRADPLAGLALTSADFADLTAELVSLVASGHVIAFLEGGYDLDALGRSSAATVGALAGERIHPEPPSSGGPGEVHVARLREFHRAQGTLTW